MDMINTLVNELVAYGLRCGLVSEDDQIFVTISYWISFILQSFTKKK